MNNVLQLALSECEKPGTVGTSPLTAMRERRNLMRGAMEAVLAAPSRENRDLRQSESRDFDLAKTRIGEIDERIAELEYEARGAAGVAETRRMFGDGGTPGIGGAHTSSETYHRGPSSPSFFKDLIFARSGDYRAAERLARNNAENGLETRALGNTNATGGSGGEFAPPGFLVESFIALARPGRVTADLFAREDLPSGVSSIVIPKVLTGSQVGPQSTQNTALMDVDPTTSALTSGIVTTGGKVIVSRQLLDQSAIPFDRMILGDLAADHARQIGSQAIVGTGTGGSLTGYLTPASTNVVTFTSTTPTAIGLYQKLAQLQGGINASRYRAPSAIVMHPRRWSWFASYVDNAGRPLVSPTASSFNSIASPQDQQPAEGLVGNVLGVDCYVDASIPTNLGTGSNQDVVLMGVMDDVMLWESPIQAEAFEAPLADSMGVLFRAFNYSSLQPSRYLASLGQISGTGLVTPTFAA